MWSRMGKRENDAGGKTESDTDECHSINKNVRDSPQTPSVLPLHRSLSHSEGVTHVLPFNIDSLITSKRHNLFPPSASCCHGNAHPSSATCGSDTQRYIEQRAHVSQLDRRLVCVPVRIGALNDS